MVTGAVAFVVLAVGFGFCLLLYWAVRAEASQRERMTRREAERAARRDTDDDPAGRRR